MLSFVVRDVAEFEAATVADDELPLMLDTRSGSGESERDRRRRVGSLVRLVFDRYGVGGGLNRDLHLLVDGKECEPPEAGMLVYQLGPQGQLDPVGRGVSPQPESYDRACLRSRGPCRQPAQLQIRIGCCPNCGRAADEWWEFHCTGCGWREVCCPSCASPHARQAFESRVRVRVRK